MTPPAVPHLGINLYAARNMEMRPLPPVPKSPGGSSTTTSPGPLAEYHHPPSTGHEYNSPTQNLSGDGVFGVPSPHSGDFCTMPMPGRSGYQIRPQPLRLGGGDIAEYPEETCPHYFELDPDGLPLPPPPEHLLTGVDVAPVGGVVAAGNNNTHKPAGVPGGMVAPPPKSPAQDNGRESMTSQSESVTSSQEPQFEYHGVGFSEDPRETGKFSWP